MNQDPALIQRLDQLESFLTQEPDNELLLNDAFTLAMQLGEYDRAGFHIQHALTMYPQDPAWQLRQALCLLAQKQFEAARPVLEVLARQEGLPQDIAFTVDYQLACLAYRDLDFATCKLHLEDWVARSSEFSELTQHLDHPTMQRIWLQSLHRLGERKAAIEWAQSHWQQHRLAPEAMGVAALIALDQNDFPHAQTWYAAARDAGMRDVETLVTGASLSLGAQDVVATRTLVESALTIAPEEGRAWSVLGFLEMLEGRFAEAQAAFDKSLHYMPGHIGTRHGLAWTYLFTGNLEQARTVFEQALELDRNFAESHGSLAVVLAYQGEKELAQEHIKRAQRLDKNNVTAKYAEAILSNALTNSDAIAAMVKNVMGNRASPTGGTMSERVLEVVDALKRASQQNTKQ